LDGLHNPSYLAAGASGRRVYAVEELAQAGGAALVTLAADQPGAPLRLLGRQPVPGDAPCHLALSPDGRWLITACYGDGRLTLHPLDPGSGLAGPAADVVQHPGPAPHAHMALFAPDGALIVADLGLDQLITYQLQPAGRLAAIATFQLASGVGPRHLTFHPGGQYAFALGELDSSVTLLAYADGQFRPLQRHSSLPAGYQGANSAAAIRLDPAGRHLYLSNRGHDSLAAFAFDPAHARLQAIGHYPAGGAQPRDFALSAGGQHILVASQAGGLLISHWRDPASGALRPTGHTLPWPAPTCALLWIDD
jgi:6-phosphogluconolactonase (cycloisomerase 2 family)